MRAFVSLSFFILIKSVKLASFFSLMLSSLVYIRTTQYSISMLHVNQADRSSSKHPCKRKERSKTRTSTVECTVRMQKSELANRIPLIPAPALPQKHIISIMSIRCPTPAHRPCSPTYLMCLSPVCDLLQAVLYEVRVWMLVFLSDYPPATLVSSPYSAYFLVTLSPPPPHPQY